MQPASPSDLSGPGRAWQGLTEPVQPVRWGSLGEPARTVPRLSESLVSPVGSFVGSVSSPFSPFVTLRDPALFPAQPLSSSLPSIHPFVRLLHFCHPVAPLHASHRIRSVPAQWAGCLFRRVFFRGFAFRWPFTIHLSECLCARTCVCAHPSDRLTRSSFTVYAYWQ